MKINIDDYLLIKVSSFFISIKVAKKSYTCISVIYYVNDVYKYIYIVIMMLSFCSLFQHWCCILCWTYLSVCERQQCQRRKRHNETTGYRWEAETMSFCYKDIGVGEELSYPYGDDKNLWWRNKACSVYFET